MKLVISEKNKKDVFISLFSIIKSNTTNICIVFKPELVFIQGMDKSHISLFNIQIEKYWFTHYENNNEHETTVCFDTNTFYNIINNVTKNQSIVIISDKSNDYVNIDLLDAEYKDKEEYNKSYKIPLLENDYDFLNIPEIEYDCEFLISSKKICDITSQMLIFGTDIKLFCSEDLIEFTTNGPTGEMNVKIDTNDLDEFSIDMGTKFDFCYNLNYLNKMCLTKNLSDKIYFSLSKDCPLKIKYDLEDTNIDINFYVSPKLDLD
jgi:proliferating cell nuclear antigen PCNA